MKIEELPFREYVMFAVGAYHAKDYELYKKQFLEIFLLQPQVDPNMQKENKGEGLNATFIKEL